ncbi:GDA1/CD39 (nucleoside phosphatase) family protein [Toxoplasma gondii ME49]|uniref:GDA1/CD39 (Nucleoside phosphatase) family protein n=2 Tax=Toxoplasma gondii TaxID=5811 RepID=A0A086KM85_TOXGO|nr:GDA1/CD39 (nucleoside phosphatase) family protein [Toxoplasma gondii ME49]EPT27035.1 GDA1/CD39 (nucleoside phosphatase) family protein [Toxoplasma gondii ME49]KFG45503.1 GDA1/CD39 (nucleoside phosphatase) family protein [Toxoplasma gondii GAB2-2007-GAL-DOM2]|eukprot:XP_002366202.2 GDA1/CD39 (nucleoside phosphatase) family protein [Toxoplasma gondii ME49]
MGMPVPALFHAALAAGTLTATARLTFPYVSQAEPVVSLTAAEHKPGPFFPLSNTTEAAAQSVGGMNILRDLRKSESLCTLADQAVVVVDGGSTGTRTEVFAITTESCPGKGRVVLPQKLRFLGNGRRVMGFRQLLETWLDAHAAGWEAKPDASVTMTKYVPELQMRTAQLVTKLKSDVADFLNTHLSELEARSAKQLGVPVFVHSTAGIRDFRDWYVDGLFLLLRSALNQPFSVDGYVFFTNPELARPITGEEEGVFAFLTLNFLAKRLSFFLRPDVNRQMQGLAGLVEVGGASLQVILPIDKSQVLPSFVKTASLKGNGGRLEQLPLGRKLVSVSFMQLGTTSSAGLLLKGICRQQKFLKNGICHNPCMPQGYEQTCSAGPPTFSSDGNVHVDTQLRRNRLIPAATYCSSANPAVSLRLLNIFGCAAIGMNPFSTLEDRIAVEGCTQIVGTGDFKTCFDQVDMILLNPPIPLPANLEASSTGFDTLGQVFRLVSTDAPVFIAGVAILDGIRTLQRIGFLGDFRGETDLLEEAAGRFCKLPVKNIPGKGLVFDLRDQEVLVTPFTITFCQELAMSVGLLKHLQSGFHVPSAIIFTNEIDDAEGKVQGQIGWPLGAVLYRALSQKQWSRDMYELGPKVNFLVATP